VIAREPNVCHSLQANVDFGGLSRRIQVNTKLNTGKDCRVIWAPMDSDGVMPLHSSGAGGQVTTWI